MAYDETFDPLPRFNNRELYEIEEVREGRIRPLEGIIRLEKIETSPVIETWCRHKMEQGEAIAPRVAYDLLKDGELHTVAWIGRVGVGYQIICDCVDQYYGREEEYEEDIFDCGAVITAINARADYTRVVLKNENYLHRRGDYETIRGMVQFLLDYSEKNPDTWLATHKSGQGLVGGFAQTFKRSYREMSSMTQAMQIEGAVTLSGQYEQIVALPKAA